ncbi:hypothetical protein [Zestomonas carbonaria]|uniref:hypothetical protein n=1 Tax=Zestomonas carbonaria TaxID=2762745 RepID=UPI001656CDBA|nr:hypothetical protein [Pseudomonas carbonaria]
MDDIAGFPGMDHSSPLGAVLPATQGRLSLGHASVHCHFKLLTAFPWRVRETLDRAHETGDYATSELLTDLVAQANHISRLVEAMQSHPRLES